MKKQLVAAIASVAIAAIPLTTYAATQQASAAPGSTGEEVPAELAQTMQAMAHSTYTQMTDDIQQATTQVEAAVAAQAQAEAEAAAAEAAAQAPSSPVYGYVDQDHDGICDNFIDANGDGYCDNHGEYCYDANHPHHGNGSGSGYRDQSYQGGRHHGGSHHK